MCGRTDIIGLTHYTDFTLWSGIFRPLGEKYQTKDKYCESPMNPEQPPQYAIDRESLERDSDITFFVAGGPGGQHRNKVASAVRLLHRPSGVVVAATERRSQSANREMAFDRLAARLAALSVRQAPRVVTRPGRAARERRRTLKRQRGETKQSRRPVRDE
jgi:protein subunit release factor B